LIASSNSHAVNTNQQQQQQQQQASKNSSLGKEKQFNEYQTLLCSSDTQQYLKYCEIVTNFLVLWSHNEELKTQKANFLNRSLSKVLHNQY